ncbi:MAG: histidine phosphatase family protein [Firmicutes bacterium]|nr:histidine phosphatase family protein [Bacillota bacterium]
MKTIVFVSRHSEPLRHWLSEYNADDNEQLRNEKNILSVKGEEKAKLMSEKEELKNIDVLYCSHYVRTMATAKYIAENNNINLNIDERLGERKFGVDDWSEMPEDFFERQFRDWDYKLKNGESLNEVKARMCEVFSEIINNNKGKNIAIISHGTALTCYLKNYCDIKFNEEKKLIEIYFNNKQVLDGNWGAPELFKLIFEDNDLIEIENIK